MNDELLPPGIHPKGLIELPAIVIYLEEGVVEAFYSPLPSTLIHIATEILEVDSVDFFSTITNLDSSVHSVVIDAPTYQRYMKSKD